MSIFRIFKSAVVLSVVLYFEGCGSKKKESEEVTEIKRKVDQGTAQVIQNLGITDPNAIAVIKAASQDLKKEVEQAAASGKELDHECVGECMRKAIAKPKVLKSLLKFDDDLVMANCKMDPFNPDHRKMFKTFKGALEDGIDEVEKSGEPIDSDAAMKTMMKSIVNVIFDKVVELNVSKITDPVAIDAIKSGGANAKKDFEKQINESNESLVDMMQSGTFLRILKSTTDKHLHMLQGSYTLFGENV